MKGSCLCGDIRFRIEGEVRSTSACHCSLCRKFSGHVWASASVAQDDVVIEHGEQSIAWYPEPNDGPERGFCVICGSSLFWRRITGDHVGIALGAIDDETGLTLQEHIYTDNKGDYYDIADSVPQHKEDS